MALLHGFLQYQFPTYEIKKLVIDIRSTCKHSINQ